MSILRGKFTDVARVGLQGEVTVWAVLARPSASDPQAVVTRAVHHAALVDGAFETGDLEPGPARISLRAGGIAEEYRIDIPADGEHELADLLETSFEYEPVVVQRAQAAAAAAAKSARDAEAAAGRVGTAERVLEAEKAARAAVETVATDRAAVAEDRVAVESARDEAVGAAASAVSDAEAGVRSTVSDVAAEALELSSRIERYRDEAEGFATSAGSGAADAGESAAAAGEKAAAAAASAEASEQARVAGEGLLVQGRSLAEQGHADADRAEVARSQAEGFARASGEQATLAEQHAREAAASAESAKQGAPEGGWTKSQLHVNVQAQLDKVDSLPTSQTVQSMIAGKADTTALQEGLAGKLDSMPVSENVTNGTLVKRTGEGRIKAAPGSAGDELVTKSQLDTKVAASDQSKIVYSRDSTGDTALPYSEDADAYTMARRTRAGSLYVGPPVANDHAATKRYVDSAVASSSSKYLLLAYANSSEMALPRTTAKPIPWVTESGTISHQHTSGADGGVLIKEPGVYHITTNFPYIDFYSDKVSYELQTSPIGGSYSTVKFTLMESSIAWDRSDSMSWPLALASQMWIRLLVTCNNGTAGGWNRNKKIKADMLLTKIA